jgi:hypothetical protein
MRDISVLLLMTLAAWAGVADAPAEARISIDVKTILASTEGKFVDPGLPQGMVQEMQSVFKYSSYRLLSSNALQLNLNQTGSAALPGNRTLRITPLQTSGDRARLRLEILKGGRQTFQTVIQLRNRGHIIVGGPRHKGGVLLFNIYNAF